MKTSKMYDVRIADDGNVFTSARNHKLRSYSRARKIAARLRKSGLDAYAAPVAVSV